MNSVWVYFEAITTKNKIISGEIIQVFRFVSLEHPVECVCMCVYAWVHVRARAHTHLIGILYKFGRLRIRLSPNLIQLSDDDAQVK